MNSGDNDESVRRIVSQALGRLAALNPAKGLALVEGRFDCIFAVCNRLTRGPHDHHVWLTFTLSFTHNSVCDCANRHACPLPLTDSLALRYLIALTIVYVCPHPLTYTLYL